MSVASEITRIQGAKADLKTAINAKTDSQHQITTETIDNYATFVNSISGGSQKPEQSKTTNPSTSQVVVTPDTGYTLSSVTVNAMPSGALSTPTINSSTGVVTASVGTSGYLANGTSSTLQLSTQSSQTITPTTTDQTISSGKYLTGIQTISGDANLVAGNIKKDVTIFGVTGTHEGGGSGTLITKSITQNGTYNASDDSADGYSQVTVNVSGGGIVEPEEKDVNFYDYDGTRLYSYTKAEFLALNSFPEAPTHLLLTSDGWNWGLTNAKNYVEEYGGLDIGHTYHSTDGATKIFIDLEGRLDPYVGIRVRGTVYVDWGDGSEVQTITKSSYGEIGRHTYAREGSYIISISPSDSNATIQFTGSSSSNDGSHIVYNGSTTSSYNSGYRGSIKKIIIGNNTISSTDYIFSKLSNLESIVIPKTFSFDYSFIFTNCYHLNTVIMPKKETNYSTPSRLVASTGIKKYILPDSINNIQANAFSGISTTKMYIPNTVTQIGGDGSAIFSHCLGLTKVTIPNSITSIGSSAFQEAYDIKIIDFTHNTQIPYLSSSSAFSSKGTDYEIWVPSSLYDSWIAASNWSSISSHIISK